MTVALDGIETDVVAKVEGATAVAGTGVGATGITVSGDWPVGVGAVDSGVIIGVAGRVGALLATSTPGGIDIDAGPAGGDARIALLMVGAAGEFTATDSRLCGAG